MWQPTRAQWRLIWTAAVLLILAWPEGNGSLAVKTINWAADPFLALPAAPRPLGLGLGDDADAVQAHDAEEAEYYRIYNTSPIGRLRLRLRDLEDPVDSSTQRQLVIGLAVLAALAVWRLEARTSS
jgi:hypothetical protein